MKAAKSLDDCNLMSLDPFIRISQKNYFKLAELKRVTMSDSIDRVLDILLDLKLADLASEYAPKAKKIRSSTQHR